MEIDCPSCGNKIQCDQDAEQWLCLPCEVSLAECVDCKQPFELLERWRVAQWRCLSCQAERRIKDTKEKRRQRRIDKLFNKELKDAANKGLI